MDNVRRGRPLDKSTLARVLTVCKLRGEGTTLVAIAQMLGYTHERIRQFEQLAETIAPEAFQRMKTARADWKRTRAESRRKKATPATRAEVGGIGGFACAAELSPKQRSDSARNAARARWPKKQTEQPAA